METGIKSISFRPLRRDKKTNKIIVASYLQWNKVRTANYNPFCLTVVDEYTGLDAEEQVYNHKGDILFFPAFDPYDLPVFGYDGVYSLMDHYENNIAFAFYSDGGLYGSPSTNYHGRGIDVCGTPTFSHFTIDQIATHYKDMNEFEPLTVKVVLNWLGWFFDRLDNSKLRVLKQPA